MADRAHSKVENSRHGRRVSINNIQNLILFFNDNIVDSLSESNIVYLKNFHTETYEIFKTYFKWCPFVITNQPIKINNDTILIEQDKNFIINFNNISHTILIDENISKIPHVDISDLKQKFTEKFKYPHINCQPIDSFTSHLSAILGIKERHLHCSEFYKDCFITTNNADISFINALKQSNSVSLPVHIENNIMSSDSIKNHCDESAEFVAGLIVPENIDVEDKSIKLIHDINGYVYKECSYKEALDLPIYFDRGVDIVSFGPVASNEELMFYMPSSDNDKFSISSGNLYTAPYSTNSLELLKTLVSNV